MKLDAGQIAALVRLIEATPWREIEEALDSFRGSAAAGDGDHRRRFQFWLEHAEAAGDDEFRIEPWEVEALPGPMKRGYHAALLRAAALNYGLGTEFGGEAGLPDCTSCDALARLGHVLVEIAAHPTGQDLHSLLERLNQALQQVDRAPEQRRGWYLMKAAHEAEAILAEIRARRVGRRERRS